MTLTQIKKRLTEQLGELSPKEQYHFQLLLDSWATYLQAQAAVKEHGQVISAQGGRLFVNPSINVMNEAHKQICKLSKLFGIVPNDRIIAEKTKDAEQWDGLIG